MLCAEVLTFCVTQNDIGNEKIFVSEIYKVKKQLENGLSYFKPLNVGGDSYFSKTKLNSYVVKFLNKVCIYLHLSEEVVHQLFIRFLASDGHLEECQLKSLLNSGHATLEMMHRLRQFYYQERLHLLRLYKLAFSSWHSKWALLSDVVFATTGKATHQDLVQMIFSDYKKLLDVTEPNWSERVNICDEDEETEAFLEQCLMEKLEIVETLLLGFLITKPTPEQFIEILSVFKSESFGRSIKILRPLVKHSHQRLIEKITLFQSLIVIRLCCFDELDHDVKEKHFLSQAGTLRHLNKAILGLGDKASHGPLLFLTAVLHLIFPSSTHPTSSKEATDITRLSHRSIRQLDVFTYLHNCLSEPPLVATSNAGVNLLSVAAHCVLYDLLVALLPYISLDSLAEKQGPFLALVASVLKVVAPHAVDRSLSGLALLLMDLSADFPLNLSLMRICTSLMSESAGDVLAFLGHLSQFADNLDSLPDNAFLPTSQDPEYDWELRLARFPYRSRHCLCIPPGTKGRSLVGSVVSWSAPFSIWDVVEGEQEILRLMLETHQMPSDQHLERVLEVLNFTEGCLQANLYLSECLSISDRAWGLLQSCLLQACTSRQPPLVMVCASVMRLTAAALLVDLPQSRHLIHRVTQRSGLLPHMTAGELLVEREDPLKMEDTRPHMINDVNLNMSLISELILGVEQPSGIYPVTQAYLSLCLSLVQADRLLSLEDTSSPGAMIGGLVFAVRHVLATFQQWKYMRSTDLLDIGEKCMLVFNETLTQNPDSSECRERITVVQHIVVHLLSQCPSAVKALIGLSSISVDTLRHENEQANDMLSVSGTSGGQLSRLVWLSVTLVNHVISHESARGPFLSAMEASAPGGLHYVAALMAYLNYPHNLKLTRMAVNLLKKIVQLSNAPLVSLLGESSSTLRDVFLRRIASPIECPLLRSALFDLLAECVLCGRPGLLHLLLASDTTPTLDSEPSKRETIPDTGCLEFALLVIKDIKVKDGSTMLLWSVAKLFSALWLQDFHSVVRSIKQSPDFWKYFTRPMFDILESWNKDQTPLSVVGIELLGHIFSVLSMEIYANGWEACSPGLKTQVHSLLNMGCNKIWCEIVLQSGSFDLMPVLFMCSGRWKSFLVVLLPPSPLPHTPQTRPDVTQTPRPTLDTKLIVEMLFKCLMSLDMSGSSSDSMDLGGQLASTLAIFTKRSSGYDCKSMMASLNGLLSKLASTSACSIHVDLLAITSIVLRSWQPSASDITIYNENKRSIFETALLAARQLSLKIELSSIEERVLIHSVNLLSCVIDTYLVTSSSRADPVNSDFLDNWILVGLSDSCLISNLLCGLQLALKTFQGLSFAYGVLNLLAQLASSRKGAVFLSGYSIEQSLCLAPLQTLIQWTQIEAAASSASNGKNMSKTCWSDLLSLSMRLMTVLLETLGVSFLPSAAGFLSSHWTQLNYLCSPSLWAASLSPQHLAIARSGLALVQALYRQRSTLHLTLQGMQEALDTLVAGNLHMATVFLTNPHYISSRINSSSETPRPSVRSPSRQLSLSSSDETNTGSPLDVALMGIVLDSLTALAIITPPLYQLIYQPDEYRQIVLDLNLNLPSLEDSTRSWSFGILLAILTVTAKMIHRVDGGMPNPHRKTIIMCQEITLSLLMAQSLEVVNHPNIESQVKQSWINELSAEMTNYMRRSHRASPSKTGSSTSSGDIFFHNTVNKFFQVILR